ncbi:putative lyase [Gemmata sp. SH-PL17]|uniref:HEAT repeat domain-containing protein n=1 Tax=Gemmata sp. SH-PL17 TaxID=1630693 RepID=UPI00078D719A|nr:HEAT repeat domain-containing protein [Gemmata sp. SH-PL17]AMV28478.1 putative lyase [Gemmata sp. SH-PL17]
MFVTAVRVVSACALVVLAGSEVSADDKDPVYEGKKFSEWASIAQTGQSVRQRSLAIDALGKIWIMERRTGAIEYVTTVLRSDKSAAVRAQAAIVIAGLREEDMKQYGAPALIDVLKTEKESKVRKEIIAAMVKFPVVCAAGVESLTPSLKDPEPAVRIAAAEALALAGAMAKSAAPELIPLLKDTTKSVRVAAVYALGRVTPEAGTTVAETMAAMLSAEKDLDIRRELLASIGLLAEKSDPIVKALTVALTDAEDEVRRGAARTLGTFGAAAAPAVEDLFKLATTDKTKDIRVDAVRAFGSALGPTGVKARLKELRPLLDPSKQPDFEVRLALVEEIAALGYDHLGVDLMSPDKGVKAEALETIVALRLRLADPQVKVREAAGIAIRKIEKKPEPKKDPEKKQ